MKTSVFRARPTCVLAGLLAICGGIVTAAQAPTLTALRGPVLRVASEGELQAAITQADAAYNHSDSARALSVEPHTAARERRPRDAHRCDRQSRGRRFVWRRHW